MIKRGHGVEEFQAKIASLFITSLKEYERECSSFTNPPFSGADTGTKRIEHQFLKVSKMSDGVNYLR
jgi:hypothetical protein